MKFPFQMYFVPRTHLQLPKMAEEYLTLLLPQLAGWWLEAASAAEDKSSFYQKFLNDVLPFFMEVLIQDAIYFVHDFPADEVSQWLNVSSPGYTAIQTHKCWALSSARVEVENLASQRTDNKMWVLNAAMQQAAVATFHHRLDAFIHDKHSYQAAVDCHLSGMEDMQLLILGALDTLPNQLVAMFNTQPTAGNPHPP
jgi:hypothetical protein